MEGLRDTLTAKSRRFDGHGRRRSSFDSGSSSRSRPDAGRSSREQPDAERGSREQLDAEFCSQEQLDAENGSWEHLDAGHVHQEQPDAGRAQGGSLRFICFLFIAFPARATITSITAFQFGKSKALIVIFINPSPACPESAFVLIKRP